LHAKFADQGLSIIGVTDETPEKTEPWIESKGAKHPYAYDDGGKLSSYFGIRGIPHSVLIDADGKVAFRGHPSEITADRLAKLLSSAWPGDVRVPLKKSQYGKAMAAAEKHAGKPYAARIKATIDGRVGQLEKVWKEGDYLTLETEGAYFRDAFEGLEAGKTIATMLDKLASDEKAQGALAAQKQIRELIQSGIDELGVEGVKKALLEIKAKHANTAAAREAEYILGQLPG
jgi:hypothetical protein